MNKKLLLLPALALILAGCGGTPAPTDWTDTDKATMTSVLGEVLPFYYVSGYEIASQGKAVSITATNGTSEQVSAYQALLAEADWTAPASASEPYVKISEDSTYYLSCFVGVQNGTFVIGAERTDDWTAADYVIMDKYLSANDHIPYMVVPGYTMFDESARGLFQLIATTSQYASIVASYGLLLANAGYTKTISYTNGVQYAKQSVKSAEDNFHYLVTAFYLTGDEDFGDCVIIRGQRDYNTPWIDEPADGETAISAIKTYNAGGSASVLDGETVSVRGTVTSLNAVDGTGSFTIQRGADAILVTSGASQLPGTYVALTATVGTLDGAIVLNNPTNVTKVQSSGEEFDLNYVESSESELLDIVHAGEIIDSDLYFVSIDKPVALSTDLVLTCAYSQDETTGEFSDFINVFVSGKNYPNYFINNLNVINNLAQGDIINVHGIIGTDGTNARIELYVGTLVSAIYVEGCAGFLTAFFKNYAGIYYGWLNSMSGIVSVPSGFTSETATAWVYYDAYVLSGADAPALDVMVVGAKEADVTAYDAILTSAGWEYVDTYKSYVNYTTYEQMYVQYEADLDGDGNEGVFFRYYPAS